MKMNLFHLPAPALFASALLLSSAAGADITKLDNTTALNTGGAWSGGIVPGTGDVAVWGSTQTVDRTNVIGGNLSWAGIKVTNPGGALYSINASTSSTLTLGASGIDMSAATANLSISALLNIGADQTWTVASGRTLTLLGTANSGTGTLSLAGTGTFVLGNSGVFGSGTVNVANGVNLASNSASGRTLGNTINLNGNMSVTMSGTTGSVLTFNGSMNVASGTQTITMYNVNGGNNNPTVAFGGSGTAAGRDVLGPGTLAFENGNVAQSPLVSLRVGTSSTDYSVFRTDVSIGNGVSLFFNTGLAFTSDVDLTVKAGGILNLSNNGGAAVSTTIGSLSGAGTVTSQRTSAAVSTLTIDGGVSTGTSVFSGNIVTGTAGASPGITKTGATTQILSGSNNYVGQTLVSGGTLLLNGVHIESTGTTANGWGSASTGHFQVGSGATFGGDGRISGINAQSNSNMVLVQSGGVLTPGSATASLRLDGLNVTGVNAKTLNMASGADFALTLAGDGSSASQIELWNYASGDLLLNNNEINLTLSGPIVAGTYTVTIFEFYSNSGTTLTTSGITSGLTLGTIDPNISGTPTLIYNSAGGTISLQYTVVPEPSVALLSGLGLALVLRRRRRLA